MKAKDFEPNSKAQRKEPRDADEGLSFFPVKDRPGGIPNSKYSSWRVVWSQKDGKDWNSYLAGSIWKLICSYGPDRGKPFLTIRKNVISNIINIYLESVDKKELRIFQKIIANKLSDLE